MNMELTGECVLAAAATMAVLDSLICRLKSCLSCRPRWLHTWSNRTTPSSCFWEMGTNGRKCSPKLWRSEDANLSIHICWCDPYCLEEVSFSFFLTMMLTNSASLLIEPSGFPEKIIMILALFGCTYKSTSKQMSVESETMYVTHPTENVLQHKVTALKMWNDCVRQVSHCVSCCGPTIISDTQRQMSAKIWSAWRAGSGRARRVCGLHTLTLKVSMVPSSSWTRQSRSGFDISVTTVTLASSQDKHPVLGSLVSRDLDAHTNKHKTTRKQSQTFPGCCLAKKAPPLWWQCAVSNVHAG